MMIKNKFSLNSFIVLALIFLGYSTQAQEKIELLVLLSNLENKHDVTFNYLYEDFENLHVYRPERASSLEKTLDELQQQLQIEFTYITVKSISITFIDSLTCLSFYDINSNKSIANLEVSNIKQNLGVTNSYGKIFIDKSLDLTQLKVSHPNYYGKVTTSKVPNLAACQSIYLYPEIELDEVLIKEYLTKGISLTPDNSLQIVPQEFGVLPGLIRADVLHSLQYVPGIVNTEETIAQISVCGGTHDQNLVLWNGSRLYQTGHFFGMISTINPLMNNEIKVIKNGSSAFYNEGVSSVIDISSREHSQDFNQIFQLDMFSANASALWDLSGKSNLQLAARRSLTDLWESPAYEGFTDKVFQNTKIQDLIQGDENRITTQQELQFFDVSLQYDYEFKSEDKLNFDVLVLHNKLVFDEVLETTSEQKRNDFKQQNFLANLTYKTNWNENHSTSIAYNASLYELEAFNQSLVSNQELLQTNQIADFKFSLSDTYQFSDLFTLNTGYQFNEVGVSNTNEVTSPEVILREKQVLITHSGIGEVEYNSENKKFKTRLGIRGNYYSGLDDLRLEPKINFSYQFNRYWRWNLLGEIKNQTLTQVIDQQQDFLGLEKRRWVLADAENVSIINNQQIEVGINFNKKGWLLQGSLYHKKNRGNLD